MRFAFEDRQVEFRDQLRSFTEKECTAAEVRAAWDSELGWSPDRWAAMAELGLLGLTVPEDLGGFGFGFLDLVLLLEEAGRSGLPEPLLETVGLAVPLLLDLPGPEADGLRAEVLPRVAIGESVLTVGLSSMVAVPAAAGADLLLLEDAGELHAVAPAETRLIPRPSIDGARRPARVDWDPTPDTLLASAAESAPVLARLADRAAVGTGALLLGVADRLIASAAAYATDRHQFGVPIGSFQAVKHQLADALVRLEFARPVVYRAAWSLDSAEPAVSRHASMAKAYAAEAALGAARTALQVHGAIGYTWEHDLQLWMKKAWALSTAWGDAADHRARVLEALLAEAAGPG